MPERAFALSGTNSMGNPATLTAPNPPRVGDLMIAVGKTTPGTGATTIPNFTADGPLQIGNVTHYLSIHHLLVAAGQTDVIVMTDAGAPTTVQFGLAEFSGVTATQDATMVSTNGGATTKTTQTTGAIVTTAATCLVTAYLGLQTANIATSITIDWGLGAGASTATIIAKANQYALAYMFGPPGTYNPTWAWPTASRVTTAIQAFQASAASSGFFAAA